MSTDETLATNKPETPEQDDLRDEYNFATLGRPIQKKPRYNSIIVNICR